MALEDTYRGAVIHWDGGYWGSPSTREIEPLALMYQSLLTRDTFVEAGLRHEEAYVRDVAGRMARRTAWGNPDSLESWKALRLQIRQGQLEAALPRRFDERSAGLREFVRGYILSPDQLEIELAV